MRIRHLIPKINYNTEWGNVFASAEMRSHKNSFGKLAKCTETPTGHQQHIIGVHIAPYNKSGLSIRGIDTVFNYPR